MTPHVSKTSSPSLFTVSLGAFLIVSAALNIALANAFVEARDAAAEMRAERTRSGCVCFDVKPVEIHR